MLGVVCCCPWGCRWFSFLGEIQQQPRKRVSSVGHWEGAGVSWRKVRERKEKNVMQGLTRVLFRERGCETVQGYRLLEFLMVSHKNSI